MTLTLNDTFLLFCWRFHQSFSLFATLLQETLRRISIEHFVLQPLISFPAKKVGVKACNQGKNVVSLHRQSKESLMCLKTVIYDDRGWG